MTNKKFYLTKPKYIQLIHVAKSKLKLSDDEYLAVLEGCTGKTSSKDMNLEELDSCLQRFKELGFAPVRSKKQFDDLDKHLNKQTRYIMVLWNEIKRHKNFRNKDANVMNFLRKQNITQVVHIRFLWGQQASKAIEMLKKYKQRLDESID
ncbi:MAG: regulatory protein GemA [Proteobacteria bacterium]|nr:regulatory protein GemA [Pseudomonadota bacterium]